jgi:hypothetical protein
VEKERNRQGGRAAIASLVPGRVRIRLHPCSRTPEVMKRIKQALESRDGIHEVRTNRANGSVTVRYDHRLHSTSGILRLLEDLDVVLESVGHLPEIGETGEGNSEYEKSADLLAAIDDLNSRISAATGIPVDLKLVLPLVFVGAGIWSIGKKGLLIETVPGWLFFWFAFDMLVKLHPGRR